MNRSPSGPAPLSARKLRAVALGTPAGLLAFGFGAGLSPKAPGTAGTLAGMLLALPLTGLPDWAGLAIVALAFVAGIPICERTSHALGVHDHGGIVWDEVAGIWLVLMTVPFHWAWWLGAFIAFRVFDIAKPWPIGWLDRRVTGGFGIMVDDLIAAFYAAGILGVVRLFV
ncbi:MAG: phosphatidylglycerophosphatase A [Wenzhouxiangellaceae bacterium]|nr:phosphatidylglycerophosphatase A [Wenzhouxiangellaceae bacterium]